MLSPAHVQVIKATAPVVGAHAAEITATFYPLMFAKYPELNAVFNQAHQKSGAQPQALANAVVAYAVHIDNLGVLSDAVRTIVEKHASLNILPAQYKIVGECLMEAIGKVLGAAVTPEIAEAWGAAYWQLAEILIAAEEAEYARKEALPGGWRGARPMRIGETHKESDVITSFILAPVDGGAAMDFTPGQYLGLTFTIDGQVMRRNYSLSAAPNGKTYRISVKREPGGVVSQYLHDRADVGATIDAYPPAGDFTLRNTNAPILIVTAGVGQTPAIPMLTAALNSKRPVRYIHAALNGAVHAFKTTVDALAQETKAFAPIYVYSDPRAGDAPHHKGMVTQDLLASQIGAETEVYFLGPTPFMKMMRQHLQALKVPDQRVSYEFFGPKEALA